MPPFEAFLNPRKGLLRRDRPNLLLARLTMNKEDGADDFKGPGAAASTRGGVCAAGTAGGLSAR